MKSLGNEFFADMTKTAQYYHSMHPDMFDLDVLGTQNETDVQGQIALVERATASRVDAIVLAPADSTALIPAVRQAVAAGIDVVNIDNRLDQQALQAAHLHVIFVGPDNRDAARRIGEAVAARLDKGDPVAIVEGIPTAYNGQQRTLGLEDAMAARGLRVVASRPGMWETPLAESVTAGILHDHPDVKAILCDNDSMALGALAALAKAGLAGKVLVSGFDNIDAIQPYLRNHQLVATADQFGDQMAVYGIRRALSDVIGFQQTTVNLIQAN